MGSARILLVQGALIVMIMSQRIVIAVIRFKLHSLSESARAKALVNSSPRSCPDMQDKDIFIEKRHLQGSLYT